MPLRRTALRPAAAVSISLALCGLARAEGLSASLEPAFGHVETETTDQAGMTTREVSDRLTQRYRLSLDRMLTQFLTAGAGATLLDERAWTRADGVWSHARGRATSLFGRLTLGTPVLSAGLGADRTEQRTFASATSFVTENYSGHASWRPKELPEVDVRIGRVKAFDTARRTRDTTTDSASVGARYLAPSYDLRYLLSLSGTTDDVARSRATAIDQTVLGSRSDRLFGGRTSTYVSATLQSRSASIEREGEGGTATRQQLPFSGLSAVEAFPATPEQVELVPNPLVVDGNTSAGAGVNVGFGPTAAGDRDLRDVGAGFADAVTPVNTIHLWLDRSLSAAVGGALAGAVAVYQSDDNQRWSAVAIVSPPAASPFENRIEVSFVQTQARYLKVTLPPLAAGVTTDLAYRDLFVTEIQFLLVLPAALVASRQSSRSGSATGTARTVLLREPDLAHDATASIARQTGGVTTYTIVNGLSASHKLTPRLVGNARGARLDQDSGRGHEGLWQWSAGLVGNPLPTAHWTLTYGGQAKDTGDVTHSLSAFGRADWYEGISTQANVGVARSVVEIENEALQFSEVRTTTSLQSGGRISLTPNPWVTLSAGGQYGRALSSAPSTGDVLGQTARVDASLSITPVPALSAAGTVSRLLLGDRPTTLGTMQLNYFPLRGDLQLGFAYSKTLDTAAEATTELFAPSLRWNIRRGVSLRSSYTLVRNDAPALLLVSRALEATLLINL